MCPQSSSSSSCFRPSPHSPPSTSSLSNLTTCLYHTHLAIFSLSFSRSSFSRSFHLHSLSSSPSLSPPPSFSLHFSPFSFWKRFGSKKLSPNFHLFWDFSNAKFGSTPEPISGFFIALVFNHQLTLLVGDLINEAYSITKAHNPQTPQSLVLKKEQVIAHKVYSTRARIAGKVRDIQIDCGYNDDSRLCFCVDGGEVLQVKHLKWKFRGNEKIDVDGVSVQISWDVYNWMFEEEREDGCAVFMFRFEEDDESDSLGLKNGSDLWFMNGIESRRMRKSFSSSSMGSSAGSSSVMEWSSVEESELSGSSSGFSLLVYAWKK